VESSKYVVESEKTEFGCINSVRMPRPTI
jgi:hypothetical protein